MKYLIYSSILLLSITCTWAGDFTIDTIIINSKVLKENRNILVFKPNDFRKTDSVTIIYLLDGEFSKCRYEQIFKGQLNRQIIGVGIINRNRNKDMLPVKKADEFLNFIEEELISDIESGFLVNKRIIYGHSFAGCFTIYSLINKPGLFDTYIASSPTPIMNMVDTSFYLKVNNSLSKEIKFYFSNGSNDMRQVSKWTDKLSSNLSTLNLNKIKWKRDVFEGENHESSDIIALIHGLGFNEQ